MSERAPRVSIGLPVYNGEPYLAIAIDSLLKQSFADLELIISDNASTDQTQEICRSFALADSRVRYLRNPRNLGASANYIRLVAEARGEYFKWAAHDDFCHPDFIQACVEALDSNPSVVAAYPQTITVDHEGKVMKAWPPLSLCVAPEPDVRLWEVLGLRDTYPMIWALIRSDVLRRTALLGNYPGHDRPFLAELCLHGPLREIPKQLFYNREHGERSVRQYDYRDPYLAVTWYDPSRQGKLVFQHWRLLREYFGAIRRAPLDLSERARCFRKLLEWMYLSWYLLLDDLVRAAARHPIIGSAVERTANRIRFLVGRPRWRKIAGQLARVSDASDILLMADEYWLGWDQLFGRLTLPFLEKDGQYYGLPADDPTAIQELERMRRAGATRLVFDSQAMWWLDHYDGLTTYLRQHYDWILENRDLVVIDLRSNGRNVHISVALQDERSASLPEK